MGGEGCQGLKKKKRSTKKLTTEIERGVHKEEKGAVGDGWERETVAEKVREGDKRGNEMPQELRGG